MRRTFWLRILILLAILFIAFGKKKEQEPFEEFSMWKVLNALSTNRPEQIKELLQPQLQQQSDINDQLNSICRFVSGIPIKKEIKSKSESRKYYNMNGNLEKEIIEFNVNFKTRANNPYQMKIKWCEYSPKKPDDKGICFLSVRYLGKTEKIYREKYVHMQKLNEEKENCMEIEKLDTRTLNNGTSMPIGKNFFRAKLKDRKQWIEGFYCRINETTYCTTDDYQKEPVKVQHLIATERSTDWGMPNQIAFYEIDPATLCQYTGISKKNKKIWENDIICHHGIYAPIRYGEYQSSFDSTKTAHIGFFVDWEHTSKPLNRKDLGYWLKSTDATIVGNIFDNPGLLGIKRTGE